MKKSKPNLAITWKKIADGWDEDFKQHAQKFVDPTVRMKAYSKWRKYAENHEYSKEEMRDLCHRMHGHNHYRDHCHGYNSEDFKKYCDFGKSWQGDRDFWREFWHNEDNEL